MTHSLPRPISYREGIFLAPGSSDYHAAKHTTCHSPGTDGHPVGCSALTRLLLPKLEHETEDSWPKPPNEQVGVKTFWVVKMVFLLAKTNTTMRRALFIASEGETTPLWRKTSNQTISNDATTIRR
ncbi:hypothetical protein VNO77_31674 [Canavalia gladiata]|uniref:Uncharacterized protein n=1 Tax=Canavalia gladiata TaxID=3824 RepID=A0AAN9KPC7_CANGL